MLLPGRLQFAYREPYSDDPYSTLSIEFHQSSSVTSEIPRLTPETKRSKTNISSSNMASFNGNRDRHKSEEASIAA